MNQTGTPVFQNFVLVFINESRLPEAVCPHRTRIEEKDEPEHLGMDGNSEFRTVQYPVEEADPP